MNHVVYGVSEPRQRKARKMGLEKSKYYRQKKSPNQWTELQLSDDQLRDAIEWKLRQMKMLKASQIVERVIVGESSDHVYSLSVAISKEGRSE